MHIPRKILVRISVVILVAGAASFALISSWKLAEPRYEGRALTGWLDQYYSEVLLTGGAASAKLREADHAVHAIGTNALPTLIRMLCARDSRLKEALMKGTGKQTLIKIEFKPAGTRRAQAQMGYMILRSTSAVQVPQLINILTNENAPHSRQGAAVALGSIGADARPALSALLVAAKDQDKHLRNSSLVALGQIKGDPRLVVSALIDGLNDPYGVARRNAAGSLGSFGPEAAAAIPALIAAAATNESAHAAVLRIDPSDLGAKWAVTSRTRTRFLHTSRSIGFVWDLGFGDWDFGVSSRIFSGSQAAPPP